MSSLFYKKVNFFSIYILLLFDTVSIKNSTIHDPYFFKKFTLPSKFH